MFGGRDLTTFRTISRIHVYCVDRATISPDKQWVVTTNMNLVEVSMTRKWVRICFQWSHGMGGVGGNLTGRS